MTSLLAMILVTKSDKGSNVVFTYPPIPQPIPRTSKPIYPSKRKRHISGYDSDSDSSEFASSSSDNDEEDDDDDDDDEANDQGRGNYLGFSKSVLASLLSPNRELCDQPFELIVDALAFIGHPVWIQDESEEAESTTLSESGESSFNFVLVIDTPPDKHLSFVLEAYHRDVIVPVTATLKYIEWKEKWSRKDPSLSFPDAPSLEASLTQLFLSLKATSKAAITLGSQSIPVQVLLRGLITPGTAQEYREDEGLGFGINQNGANDDDRERERSPEEEGEFRDVRPALYSRSRRVVNILPWQTLLPLEDPEVLRELVPEGSFLHRFIEIWSPTLSFSEYETLLDVEPGDSAMREVIEHLIHWRKGRVIDLVSLKQIYTICSGFKPASLVNLTPLFSSSFPFLPPLPLFLSLIPSDGIFSNMIAAASQRPTYLSALIWLLTNQVVEKQRLFVRIVASEGIKLGAKQNWHAEGGQKDSMGEEGTSSSIGAESMDDSPFTRKRTTSARVDHDDSRSMAIVSTSPTSPPPPLARSQQSSMMMKLPRNRRNSILGSGTGRSRTLSTFSSNSERPDDRLTSGTTIILEPGRASAVESRWLKEIAREKDSVIVEKFERMVRMFNGAHDIDEIRQRSSLTRKDVRLVLAAFDPHLILFSHP